MAEKTYSFNEKSIVFIGFMGVGKTTIAKRVAKNLNRQMIDIDQEIEKQFNMPTTEIFKKYGEPFFREKEKEITLHYCKKSNLVISLGGGAFLQENIKRFCLDTNIVIFLDISFEEWKKRIPRLINTRPILQNKSIEEIQELFKTRQSIYKDHHIKIVTDGLNSDEVVDNVIQALESYDINE